MKKLIMLSMISLSIMHASQEHELLAKHLKLDAAIRHRYTQNKLNLMVEGKFTGKQAHSLQLARLGLGNGINKGILYACRLLGIGAAITTIAACTPWCYERIENENARQEFQTITKIAGPICFLLCSLLCTRAKESIAFNQQTLQGYTDLDHKKIGYTKTKLNTIAKELNILGGK